MVVLDFQDYQNFLCSSFYLVGIANNETDDTISECLKLKVVIEYLKKI